MDKNISYAIIGLMAIFLIYEGLSVMNTQYYVAHTDTQNMTAGTNYSFSKLGAGLYSVTSLHNSTTTCADYTTNTTAFTLKVAGDCASLGIYSMDYKYKQPTTVMGIDFAFIAAMSILVFLIVAYNALRK